jgi:hypothetical protein
MPSRREIATILLAAFAFGVVVAVVKGQDAGARDALGNTSAPWIVVPFLAGMRFPSAWRGALAGVAATAAAFLGFYLSEAAILDLGPHPWYVDLQLTMGTVNVYEKWGLVSGSAYGALGAVWATRRAPAAAVAVGLAFIAEPLIVSFLQHAGVWGGGGLLEHPMIWGAEVLLGATIVFFAFVRTRGMTPR